MEIDSCMEMESSPCMEMESSLQGYYGIIFLERMISPGSWVASDTLSRNLAVGSWRNHSLQESCAMIVMAPDPGEPPAFRESGAIFLERALALQEYGARFMESECLHQEFGTSILL